MFLTGDCAQCPVQESSVNGSTRLVDCKCLAGYNADADGVECTACPAGTLTGDVGGNDCAACPSKLRSDVRSVDCKCLAGYTLKLDSQYTDDSSYVGNGWECVECNANTFKSNVGNMACDKCPHRMQSKAGSDAKSDCHCILPLG